ncbi:unnamed protein product [Cunninghamella echinulata]
MNVSLHSKRKKLKPTCHILTIKQIKSLGNELKLSSLNQAMELFNQPANIYNLNKPKLSTIHKYLLNEGLTQVKQSSRIKQPDQARLLVDLIYPGYPQGKAREQACRQERESKINTKSPGLFAYDQLPMTDKLERLYELLRLDTCSTHISSSSTYYTIDTEKLNLNTLKENIRLHMFLWISPRHAIFPQCSSLKLNDKETWNDNDQTIIQKGFKYIDITNKIDWQKINKSDEKSVKLEIKLNDKVSYHIKYVTICSIWKKTNEDLACQLYIQSSSSFLSKAITPDTQPTIIELLNQYPPKVRWQMNKAETFFLDCGRMFYQSSKDSNSDPENDDEEIIMGSEYISLMDPIMLTRIEHPTRSIFCRHVSCFDAKCFFNCFRDDQLWTCPICDLQIRGIQDLYIDYPLKRAITTYPKEDRFIYSKDGEYQTEEQYKQPKDQPPLPFTRPSAPIVIKNEIISSLTNETKYNNNNTNNNNSSNKSDDDSDDSLEYKKKDSMHHTNDDSDDLKRPAKRLKHCTMNDDEDDDNDKNYIIIS